MKHQSKKINKNDVRYVRSQDDHVLRDSRIFDFCVRSDLSSPGTCVKMINSARAVRFGIDKD
jgi:hypothetical protein